MAGPTYKFKIGGVEGTIWDGKYGPSPAISVTKADKDKNFRSGTFVDKDGGKIYLNQRDVINMALVCDQLAREIATMEAKSKEETQEPEKNEPKF